MLKPNVVSITFDDVKIGKTYIRHSNYFDVETDSPVETNNRVTCISDDFTGLNRDIKYFCFTDRISRIPTKEEFVEAMKENSTLIPRVFEKKQYRKACWMLEIRKNTFAIWKFSMDELHENLDEKI